METTLLDGRTAADAMLGQDKATVDGKRLKLVVVQVGDDPASSSYIKQKKKSSQAVGLDYEHQHLPLPQK